MHTGYGPQRALKRRRSKLQASMFRERGHCLRGAAKCADLAAVTHRPKFCSPQDFGRARALRLRCEDGVLNELIEAKSDARSNLTQDCLFCARDGAPWPRHGLSGCLRHLRTAHSARGGPTPREGESRSVRSRGALILNKSRRGRTSAGTPPRRRPAAVRRPNASGSPQQPP